MSALSTTASGVAAGIANRGQNLLATSILGLGGLVFGSVLFQEQDLPDRIDDAGFLTIAITALAWYLWPGNSRRRSWVPVVLAAVTVAVQIVGLLLEQDDPKAFGDNIGGIVYFGVGLGLIAFQQWRTGSIIDRVEKEV